MLYELPKTPLTQRKTSPDFPTRPPKQVAVQGFQNSVPFNLADVTLFVAQTDESNTSRSRLLYANSLTGAREANLTNSYAANVQANDIAVNPAGTVVTAIQRQALSMMEPIT